MKPIVIAIVGLSVVGLMAIAVSRHHLAETPPPPTTTGAGVHPRATPGPDEMTSPAVDRMDVAQLLQTYKEALGDSEKLAIIRGLPKVCDDSSTLTVSDFLGDVVRGGNAALVTAAIRSLVMVTLDKGGAWSDELKTKIYPLAYEAATEGSLRIDILHLIEKWQDRSERSRTMMMLLGDDMPALVTEQTLRTLGVIGVATDVKIIRTYRHQKNTQVADAALEAMHRLDPRQQYFSEETAEPVTNPVSGLQPGCETKVIRAKKSKRDRFLDFVSDSVLIQTDVSDRRLKDQFAFINRGEKAVTILELKASCGCMAVELEKKSYLPGEGGVIEVEMNAKGVQGKKVGEIYVQTDENEGQNRYSLEFSLETPVYVIVEPAYVIWAKGAKPVGRKVRLQVIQPIDVMLSETVASRSGFRIDMLPVENGRLYEIELTPEKTTETLSSVIRIKGDSNLARELDLKVHAYVR